MGFGVLFVMLIAVCGWWLYTRWSELSDAKARRREAELLFVFQARTERGLPVQAKKEAGNTGEFHPTLPGDH